MSKINEKKTATHIPNDSMAHLPGSEPNGLPALIISIDSKTIVPSIQPLPIKTGRANDLCLAAPIAIGAKINGIKTVAIIEVNGLAACSAVEPFRLSMTQF